jgi:hypothetical protein
LQSKWLLFGCCSCLTQKFINEADPITASQFVCHRSVSAMLWYVRWSFPSSFLTKTFCAPLVYTYLLYPFRFNISNSVTRRVQVLAQLIVCLPPFCYFMPQAQILPSDIHELLSCERTRSLKAATTVRDRAVSAHASRYGDPYSIEVLAWALSM